MQEHWLKEQIDYKGMFAIALTSMPKEYIYKSEVETGYGRDGVKIDFGHESVEMI